MTAETQPPKRPLLARFGSNLMLGFLVTALSVFTAVTNYATYNVSGISSDYETEGTRLLADANTEYILATQYVIVDYDMYDGFVINQDLDNFAADYYQANYSDALQSSVDRDNPFDDQYYNEMYANADDLFNQAFNQLDLSDAAAEREAGFQLAMLIAAVGLAFAAYGSLLNETNRMRGLFALLSLGMLILSVGMFAIT